MRGEAAGPRVSECAHARGVVCLHQCGCEVPEGASTGGRMGERETEPWSPNPSLYRGGPGGGHARLLTVPPVGLLRKPDHETVSSVLRRGLGIVVRTQNLEKGPPLRETPPHPSLAFREAVTGFCRRLGDCVLWG